MFGARKLTRTDQNPCTSKNPDVLSKISGNEKSLAINPQHPSKTYFLRRAKRFLSHFSAILARYRSVWSRKFTAFNYSVSPT